MQEPAIDEELVAEMEELRKRVMELQVTLVQMQSLQSPLHDGPATGVQLLLSTDLA